MADIPEDRRVICPLCLRIFQVSSLLSEDQTTTEHNSRGMNNSNQYPRVHLRTINNNTYMYIPKEETCYHIHLCKDSNSTVCKPDSRSKVNEPHPSQIIAPLRHSSLIATPLSHDLTDSVFEPSNYLKWSFHKSWNYRILRLIFNSIKLQSLMAWCNTLGGAHSSLGDSMSDHAVKAGIVSLNQLALSSEMGDGLMKSKSRLFLSFSLLQQRKLPQAKKLIKSEYSYLTKAEFPDQKLVDMCLSAWNRYKSLKEQQTS